MKRLAILGSTGSIGVNCLKVVASHPDQFQIAYLAAGKNIAVLFEQAKRHRPKAVAIANAVVSPDWQQKFASLGVQVLWGGNAPSQLAGESGYDLLVNAIVGAAGFLPTLCALANGKNIALANKETLVMAGALVLALAQKHKCTVIPIDSEHSAIFQCLMGEAPETVEKIILTASGGPFRGWAAEALAQVSVAEALKHPNWQMGPKISIDSATLMNKGLEVIEAHWLFQLPAEKIEVIIHPQSIVHSMVEFVDGAIKAQLGPPDMQLPIQWALAFPQRLEACYSRFNFDRYQQLEFEPVELSRWPCLQLAYQALARGGTAPTVLNAANEMAVALFLQQKIPFHQIPMLIEAALEHHENFSNPDVDGILVADTWARNFVLNFT